MSAHKPHLSVQFSWADLSGTDAGFEAIVLASPPCFRISGESALRRSLVGCLGSYKVAELWKEANFQVAHQKCL